MPHHFDISKPNKLCEGPFNSILNNNKQEVIYMNTIVDGHYVFDLEYR